jgi:hypothetical protein
VLGINGTENRVKVTRLLPVSGHNALWCDVWHVELAVPPLSTPHGKGSAVRDASTLGAELGEPLRTRPPSVPGVPVPENIQPGE